MYDEDAAPSNTFGAGCEGAEARDIEISRLADVFVEVAVELSLLQVRQLDITQQLLAHQGAIAGSVANWLSQRAGLSCREAKQLCRVAKRLPDLPLIDEAFRAGRLSLDTADVLLKVATPTNQAVLLETAGAATGAQLRKIIATFKRIRDHDQPEADRPEELTFGSDDESMWALRTRLQPGHGGEVEAALRAAKEDARAKSEPGADRKRAAVSNVEAFMHLCRSYLEGKVTATGQLPERFLTIVHVDLARAQHAAEDPDPDVAGGGGADGEGAAAPSPNRAQRRRHARLHGRRSTRAVRRESREKRTRRTMRGADERREARDLLAGRVFDADDRDDIASLRGMGAIDGASLERFLCDSLVSVVDHHGVDVTATAPVRLATPAQRRALAALHPTCQYPGCGRTQYLQAHHLVDYHPITGPTALWNLALLCDEHHDQLHRAGWAAALTDDHELLVWTPKGVLVNRGALRSQRLVEATDAKRAKSAKSAKSADDAETTATADHDPDTTPAVDVSQRLHGVGDRMDAWALDTYLHFWLEATAA